MNQQDYLKEEQELSFEERFKLAVEKFRPYILRLWKARWKFVKINAAVLVLTLAYLLFLTKPYFDSSVVILPDFGNNAAGMLGQLSGLASLAGVNVGEAAPTEIYQNLLTSESVLEPVVYAKYNTEEFDHPVNLIEYFELEPDESLPDSLQQRGMFLQLLKKLSESIIKTDVDRMTKILTVTVRMPEAQLSADVANNLVKGLNGYVVNKMKTFASEQRKYLDKRIAQVKDSLNIAENNLKEFRETNRMVMQSPQLMLAQARLTRNVEILNAVYIELMKQYELVKLQEVKDAPVLNIREQAKNPVKKTGPKRAISLILIMFFSGIFVGLYIVFSSEIKQYYGMLKGERKE